MKRNAYFEDLKEGLNSAIAHADGKIDLRTTSLVVPDPPPKLSKTQIKQIREKELNLSQPVFALYLGVSPAAVKAWEQGLKQPSGSARRLMQILRAEPQLITRLGGKKKVS